MTGPKDFMDWCLFTLMTCMVIVTVLITSFLLAFAWAFIAGAFK